MGSFGEAFSVICAILVLLEVNLAESYWKAFDDIPSQQGIKFGCAFQKNYYVGNDSVFDPVYGKNMKPMDFANVTEFQDKLLKGIKEEYSTVLEELVYNNVPVFFDFYDMYKTSNESDVLKFFKNYVPKYFPGQDLSVTLLDRLIGRFPRMSQSVHLITSSSRASKPLLHKLGMQERTDVELSDEMDPKKMGKCFSFKRKGKPKSKSLVVLNPADIPKEPPKFFFEHDHVAALLRFCLAGSRRGYVLMDLEFGLESPIVIMEDGEPPHQPSSLEYGSPFGGELRFSRHGPNFLLAQTFTRGTADDFSHAYYIGKPYCSFLLTSTKAHIANMWRKFIRRDNTGLATAFIKFDTNQEDPKFYMGLSKHEEGIQFTSEVHIIPFGSRHQLNETMQKFYNQVIATIKLDGLEDMLNKAEAIAKDIQFELFLKSLASFLLKNRIDFSGLDGSVLTYYDKIG